MIKIYLVYEFQYFLIRQNRTTSIANGMIMENLLAYENFNIQRRRYI